MGDESVVPSGSGQNLAGGSSSANLPSPPSTTQSQVTIGVDLPWFRNHFRPHFDEWVFRSIDRMLSAEDALVAFIVMSCAIDYLAGFLWGKSTKGHVGNAYEQFVDQYFPPGRYDARGLYDSLHNGLIHMFTIKDGKYVLTHENPSLHLKNDSGRTVLNAADFYADLVQAKESYFDDVETKPSLLTKLVERYDRDGFLDHILLTVPK